MSGGEDFPEEIILKLQRKEILRYGENPHQKAALYVNAASPVLGVSRAEQLQGKELSYNNINDADAALECVAEFSEPAAVIVKHMNPCGVAVGSDMHGAYQKAFVCDTVSAFGGIIALNRALDRATAEAIAKIFVEVIIAPAVDADALEVMSTKPNVRVLTVAMSNPKMKSQVVRSVAGGFLITERDSTIFDGELKTVTKRQPSESEIADMKFAFTVAKYVKSNAIVYAKNGATVGIGAGQMSRIYSAKIAALKAQEAELSLEGAVMASDAFMPFPDCVVAAREAGATAIIQPGGSLKDQDSIDAANEAGMSMVFTGIRHFRH
jgi:phosphoribosylaminoimidazolecarboxamide formyltransferase / IMP cyclohydrolase